MADENIRGKFLWHELMAPDPAAAVAFYGKVVGWTAEPYPGNPDYTLLKYGKPGMGGILKHETPRMWMCYIGTPNVDVTAREAVQLGGSVIKPADDIPNVGRFAILADPQGAMFIAFKPNPREDAPSRPSKPGVGDFHWHELMTTDANAAWTFYERLFGWQKTDAMEMGPGQTYQMFAPAGPKDSVGGMFNKSSDMPGPPAWLPYAIVKDAKAAAKAIEAAGGQVINGPMEVPGGDWIAAGIDTQGVMFAVHSRKATMSAAAAAPKPAKQPSKTSATAKRAKPAAKKAKAARAARPARATSRPPAKKNSAAARRARKPAKKVKARAKKRR